MEVEVEAEVQSGSLASLQLQTSQEVGWEGVYRCRSLGGRRNARKVGVGLLHVSKLLIVQGNLVEYIRTRSGREDDFGWIDEPIRQPVNRSNEKL